MTNKFYLLPFVFAASISLTLSACAPNAWQSPLDGPLSNAVDKIDNQLANCAPGEGQSGAADAFMTLVQNKCWGKHIGSMMISNNMSSYDSSAYFLDLTSRFYCGAVDRASYVNSLESFLDANADQDGVVCIVDLAAKENPHTPQQRPGSLSAPPQ